MRKEASRARSSPIAARCIDPFARHDGMKRFWTRVVAGVLASVSCVSLDTAGGSGKSCDAAKCTSAQICVAYRTVGGGLIPPDAGACPDGTHVEPLGAGESCQQDYVYKCVPRSGCAANAVSWACGSASCAPPYSACSDPESGEVALDPSARLVCQQLAP